VPEGRTIVATGFSPWFAFTSILVPKGRKERRSMRTVTA
jgi:hypothetical protein